MVLLGQLHANNIYVIKIQPNGTLAWAISMTGTSINVCNSLVVDMNSNAIYAGGYYARRLVIGDTWLLNSNYLNYFLAKFSPQRDLLWYVLSFPARMCASARG